MFCYTDQVQSGHGLLLMTSCNYSYNCKEKINIRQVVKYNTKLCNGSCFIDVMCICCSYRSTVAQWVPLVEQDLRSLPENLSSPRGFDRSLIFCAVWCSSYCVLFLLATVHLSLFDLRLLSIRLVTSNLSYVRQLYTFVSRYLVLGYGASLDSSK